MRRTLLGLAAATLVLSAVPALAGDEPAALAACEGVLAADRLTLTGTKGAMPAPLTPSPTLSAAGTLPRTTPDTTRTVVLDLAGQPVGTTATVGAVLTWGQYVNDFDLFLASGEDRAASQKVNPTEMEASEEAGLGGVGHCEKVTVRVHNYAAGPESLALALAPVVEEPLAEE